MKKKTPSKTSVRIGKIGDYLFLRKGRKQYKCVGDENGKHDPRCKRIIKPNDYYIECRRYVGTSTVRGLVLSRLCGWKYWGQDFYKTSA